MSAGGRARQLRVALLAAGSPLSRRALESVVATSTLVAVVLPERARRTGPASLVRRLLFRPRGAAFVSQARQTGVPILHFSPRHQERLWETLAAVGTDLVCVAAFPHLVRSVLLEGPALGALNVHPSVLPRHRGPDPLYWTYVSDDRETGITVHWMTEEADRGPIVLQERMPLARGCPIDELYGDLAEVGGRLLSRALEHIADGTAPRTVQDEAVATYESAPPRGATPIDFETWGAERVWHVLAGLGRHYDSLLPHNGRTVVHGPAIAYRLRRHDRVPGTIVLTPSSYTVYCRDGIVDVAAASVGRRVVAAGSRLWRR